MIDRDLPTAGLLCGMAAVLSGVACGDGPLPPPVAEAVEPNVLSAITSVPIVIFGRRFYVRSQTRSDTRKTVVLDNFTAMATHTASGEQVALANAFRVDVETLAATAPAGIREGTYSIRVDGPTGRSNILESAFIVCPDSDGDGRCSASAGCREECDHCTDQDGDGWGRIGTDQSGCDGRGDDCDDRDSARNPGSVDLPDDGVDQDCSGTDAQTCYVDADMDGYGTEIGMTVVAADGSCDAADHESAVSTDCDDSVATGFPINPGAIELCDGLDNDCANGIDDGLPATIPDDNVAGECAGNTKLCDGGMGWVPSASNYTPVAESCDGLDNDCANGIDDGLPATIPDDNVAGECAGNTKLCDGGMGWVPSASNYTPVAESCDGLDNDCANGIDDGLPATIPDDNVAGECAGNTKLCDGGMGWVPSASNYTPVAESCDGLDNDCANGVDDGLPATIPDDNVAGECAGNTKLCDGGMGWVPSASNYTPVAESCDGLDNDCANGIDDGLPATIPDDNVAGECAGNTKLCDGGMGWVPSASNYTPVAESCDGLDNDCANGIDDGLPATIPDDNVAGECAGNTKLCDGGMGWVPSAGNYTPVAESCDGLDNDCANGIDDGLPVTIPDDNVAGECAGNTKLCDGGMGWVPSASNYTPVAESCDGLDNDCANGIDDGLPATIPDDNVAGECAGNTKLCDGGMGWVPSASNYSPVAESCDGLDNDCANGVDDGLPATIPDDNVAGECAGNTKLCDGGVGWVPSASNYTPVAESCDGLDNDCDGNTDNDCSAASTCVWTTWAGFFEAPATTYGAAGSLVDPPSSGSSYAAADWVSQSAAEVYGFDNGGNGAPISKVEAVLVYWVDNLLGDDRLEVKVVYDGDDQGAPELLLAELDRVGAGRAGPVMVDVTAKRAWAWADFEPANWLLRIVTTHVANGPDDMVNMSIDAVGFRISHACNTPPVARLDVKTSTGTTADDFYFGAGPPTSCDAACLAACSTCATSCTGSCDAEEGITGLVYRLDCDDSGSWIGPQWSPEFTCHYGTPGIFEAVLEVTDAGGGIAYATDVVAVHDVAADVFTVTSEADTGPGSLNAAIAALGGNGDVIIFDPSVATITLTQAMTQVAQPVAILGGGDVTIEGSSQPCLELTRGPSLVAGLSIKTCAGDAITLDAGIGEPVTVRDCLLDGNGASGVGVSNRPGHTIGPGNTLSNNTLHGVHLNGGGSDSVSITGNTITGNGWHGIYGASGPDFVVVENNVIHDNGMVGIYFDLGSIDPRIELNEIWNHTTNVRFSIGSTGGKLRFNTLVQAGGDHVRFLGASCDDWEIVNNIFADADGYALNLDGSSLLTYESNLFYDVAGGSCDGCGNGLAPILLDPQFHDQVLGDFRLLGGSPAVDSGTDIGIDVNARLINDYNGVNPDRGGIESP